jgi:transposase
VGPVIAATVIGEAGDVSRFGGRDRFAAYNGTAPIEVSSGQRTVHRLSRRGNRRLNHAVHMAAVTQVSQRHSDGRAYYDKKAAEGKTAKEALRALKRQVSDAIYQRLKADAARAATGGPGGQPGTTLSPARPAHTPDTGSSAKPLPDLTPPYDPGHTPLRTRPHPAQRKRPGEPLDAKRSRYARLWTVGWVPPSLRITR